MTRAAHDALFDSHARRAFMGSLSRHGYRYEDIASGLQGLSLPRPSAGSHLYRALVLRVVAALPHAEVWEVCDRIASLYDGAIHLPAAPPADEDGYLSALLEDAPVLCAPAAVPTHTTHCHGARVWWSQCVRPPVVATDALCEVLDG